MKKLRDLKISRRQTFLENFKKRDKVDNVFYYGLGGVRPSSPFLLQISTKTKSEIFSGEWMKKQENFSSDLSNKFNFEGEAFSILSKKEFLTLIQSAAEVFSVRISPIQVKCTICNNRNSQSEIIDHIIERHSAELIKFLKPHIKFINDDSSYMHGLLTKLQFPSEISWPKKESPKQPPSGLGITPPLINNPNSSIIDDDSEEDSNDPVTHLSQMTPNDISDIKIMFKDSLNAPLTKFIKKRTQSVNLFSKADNDYSQLRDCLLEPDKILEEFLNFYTGSPKVTNLHLIEHLEENNNNNKQSSNRNNRNVKKKPEFVPYIQSIPEKICPIIVSNIAQTLIKTYVEMQSLTLIRPLFQQKKKLLQKKRRDERFTQAKNEEKQKLKAMRERREKKIEYMSNIISQPFIRQFIKNEISQIFDEESMNPDIKKSQFKTEEIENAHQNPSNNPIVISGLVYRRHLSAQFLFDTFSHLNIALDENSRPKIRFRRKGNRIEAILFLSSQNDIIKALEQNPYVCDSGTFNIFLDQEKDPQCVLYNEQEINIIPYVKHTETIQKGGGKNSVIEMNPCFLYLM